MSDHPALSRFRDKSYRDGYLQTQVRGNIAYQIQALRDKFGLSQTDFAHKIGKKQSVVSRLENAGYGRVSVQTLLDIATALDVALLVQFTSYPDFLNRTADMSSSALKPKTIFESLQTTNQFSQRLVSASISHAQPYSTAFAPVDRPSNKLVILVADTSSGSAARTSRNDLSSAA